MSIFDGTRLTQQIFQLSLDGLRRGYFSDKYFENVIQVLEGARADGYRFVGDSPRALPVDPRDLSVGDIQVEAQIFNRRTPFALVAGVDMALTMLRYVTGHYEGQKFVEAWQSLQVEAVHDGIVTRYSGDTQLVEPVIRIRGPYREFALLETMLLGVLTRMSRVATNVYHALQAAGGKTIFFMPARFDLPEVQPADGYAYWLAVQRFNADTGLSVPAIVSSDAQAFWWGGYGSGTVPHSLIACFLADTAEAMLAFARYVPPSVLRVALVDFNNDTVGATLATLSVYWSHYVEALRIGDREAMQRWTLFGVRLDTSANMRDVALDSVHSTAAGGVNPSLARIVREAIDHAWQSWNVQPAYRDAARDYCRAVRIIASGGFNAEKIARFEADDAPVDLYGVGSSLLRNADDTNTDYTMDVVRVLIDSEWVDIAKVGRRANDNPALETVDLGAL